MITGWVAFKDQWPPKSKRLDDPAVETTDTVLVTNNINSRDAMGRMSHVWLLAPVGTQAKPVGYTDNHREILGLTHWKDAGLKDGSA